MIHPVHVRAAFLAALSAALAFVPAGAAEDTSPENLKKELKEILATRNGSRMTGFVNRLAKVDDPKTVAFLVEGAFSISSNANYQTALKAISTFSNEKTLEELVLLLKEKMKDFRGRVLILDGFGLRKDPATRAAIYDALDDKAKAMQVQVTAIHACVARKEKEAVPELIKLLKNYGSNRDRILVEAREALTALTDEDFDDIKDWEKFWESHKDSLNPANLNEGKGPTKVVKIKKTKESVEFFGAEILSKNVMFVIDSSGSMILYDDDPDPNASHKDIEVERRRVERAKAEMLNAISKLRARSKFNIIAFNSTVFPWKKFLVPATNDNIGSARGFVKKFQPDKLTYTDAALEKAFEDPNIDTIVLLSDGAPEKGGMESPFELQDKILNRVKDLNSSRKIRIDTFGFEGEGKRPRRFGGGSTGMGGGDSSMVKFLKKLASDNGGVYRPIK